MVDIPYHTHQFDIPTASEGEIRTGVEAGKAITPDKLFPVLADKADKSTTLAGYGIVDAATKEQGQKADTAVQPEQVSAVGFSGRYDDLLNKPSLGSASGLNVGTTAGTVTAGDDARIVNAAQKSITVTAGAGLSGGGTLAANIALALSSTSLASLALADTAVQPSRKLTAGAGLTGGGDFAADRTVALNAASIASLAKADTAVQPPAIANFATKAELTAGLATKLDTGAQAADSAKLQGFTTLTLPVSTATQTALDGKATAAQGAKADTAVQLSDLGALATKSKVATTDIDATGSTAGGALLTRGGVWVDPSGGGDMFRATYDPTNKAADAFSMGNMAETTAAKVMTAAERTKLAGIPADADKTPALATVATTGSYDDLSGKPATFPPSAHTHTPSEVGLGNVPNKTEAQMASSGAIADALGGKVSFTAQTLSEAEAGQARANLGAGILAGFRNKIINGDFDIWQRNVSQSISGYGSDDRWHNWFNGGTLGSNSRAITGTVPEASGNPSYYSKMTITTVSDSGFCAKEQRIEGIRTLAGKKATLTFYAKANSPRQMGVSFRQNYSGGSPLRVFGGKVLSLTTTMKRFDIIVDIPNHAGQSWTAEGYLSVLLWLHVGATSGVADVAALGNSAGDVTIGHVSLVEGDAAAEADPFSLRHIQQEIALCQRYFKRITGINTQAAGVAAEPIRSFQVMTEMRTNPTVVSFTGNTGSGWSVEAGKDWVVLIAFPNPSGLIGISDILLDAEL
ncbi:hypothetical protein KHQ08_07140 [Pseudochrobactrum algeriensis]|uniref:hypothetical protein n=1 Tax=Pseudochrobactrum algeriensis TaxID=2834768 RepID=UPI001BCE9AEC|nr:hypothetical protein [Pseudochrobactrum algeriensis]QVQ37788.1 hypothetical protein KHQ08_07140 [Pseudochrobactrum algeriensis]QVQ41009.1 hypothetical protein KHQ07_05440 [Pseudochrobactrum algeriensis]QVQ44933.1 hypothetical protein KHQ09_07405 [Pseudochrobactrum algeriensis]